MNEHERNIAAEEQAEAAAEARRQEAEAEKGRILAEMEREHTFRKKLARRQTAVLTACAAALDTLSDDATLEDDASVEQARRRVLSALTESFFDPPEPAPSPWLAVAEALSERLPEIAAALGSTSTIRDCFSGTASKPAACAMCNGRGQIVQGRDGTMVSVACPMCGSGRVEQATPPTSPYVTPVREAQATVNVENISDEQRFMLMRAAQMIHTTIMNGDSPDEFVDSVVSSVPSMILRRFCEKPDNEIYAAICWCSPSTVGATPAGKAFTLEVLGLLREEMESL